MRKYTLFIALAFGICSSAASLAQTDGSKIGTVDMQKALQSVDAGKKAKEKLEKEFNSKKKELQAEETAIRKMGEEFKKQSLVLNEEARAKKQQEIQERVMRFQEFTQKSQMEIQSKERDLTAPLVDKLKEVINTVAKSKGYSIILEKNENSILVAPEKDDLTTEVISAFNKAHKG